LMKAAGINNWPSFSLRDSLFVAVLYESILTDIGIRLFAVIGWIFNKSQKEKGW